MDQEQNKLVVILSESGLDRSRAQFILAEFQEAFADVAEWEQKAKEIIVTDETQVDDIEQAEKGYKILKKIRTGLEKSRVQMKKDPLNECRVIDGLAKTLTGLVQPVEDYLEKQAKFVEIKRKAALDARQREMIRRMNEEDLELSRIEGERKAKLEEDNERLRKEAAARDKEAAAEKQKATALILEEKRRNAEKERELEEKATKEREASEKASREAQEKADSEKRAIEEKARKEREEAEEMARSLREIAEAKLEKERREREELQAKLDAQVTCPKCGHKFTPKK